MEWEPVSVCELSALLSSSFQRFLLARTGACLRTCADGKGQLGAGGAGRALVGLDLEIQLRRGAACHPRPDVAAAQRGPPARAHADGLGVGAVAVVAGRPLLTKAISKPTHPSESPVRLASPLIASGW